ncbi:protein of unknown function DUF4371 [Trinorchestia longiramus]|nr:protein of unknown function DUF4371 [Trinorchestia longiramus]
MSGAKKRKYSDEYIKYGFTVIERNGFHLPQCVICHTVFSNDASRPGLLGRHLCTNHKALKEKPKEFFTAKLHELNRMKLDSTSVFHQETWKLVEASYELSLLIAEAKKPHSCDESTDVAHLYQLLVYSRFVDEGTAKEEILFSAALETTAKAFAVFSKVDEFFQKHGLSWEKLVGVCTDGAPSMIGSRSGFVKLVKEKSCCNWDSLCYPQTIISKQNSAW